MEFGKPWFVKETEKAFGLCFVILGRRRDRRRLYSKVNPANLNLRPDVDESSTEDTRSIRFDVNEEWIEKEVDEVTKPSPNQRLLRHLRILRRTTKTKHENDSRYQTEAYSETAEVWWIDLVWNVLGPIPELCTTQPWGTKHRTVTLWTRMWLTSCGIIGKKWPNHFLDWWRYWRCAMEGRLSPTSTGWKYETDEDRRVRRYRICIQTYEN